MYLVATEKEKETIKALVEKLNKYTEYYDKGQPLISDKEWDDCYFELVALEEKTGYRLKDSPTQKVVYKKISKLQEVEHNHLMLSLDKTKDIKEIESFIGNKNYIAMCKMDGLTCSLRYIDGKLVSAETRGNGIKGEDILHNAQVISNIPISISFKDELIIDGEIICNYEEFEKFKDEYSHPRNFAAGKIRVLDSSECYKANLSFVAWDVIKGFNDKKLSNKLDELNLYGFEVVPYCSSNNFEKDVECIKQSAQTYAYPIDGVVFKYDDVEYYKSLGNTGHHFRGGMAYKFYDEEYETELIDIEWTMGRTGVLTPVAIYKDIDIDGTICNRASLHNLSVLRDTLGLYPDKNEKIWVYKANQIIPQISRAEKNDIPHDHVLNNNGMNMFCPICGKLTEIKNNDGVLTLHCTNSNCEGKLINKLDHYLGKKGLDVKGLSKATLEKLIDWGWVSSISDIYNLSTHAGEWKNKSGFGEKSVNNILNAIEVSKNCNLESFISGLGIPLIGRSVSKVLAENFKTWDMFMFAVENLDFEDLDGFGPEMNRSLKNFDYTEAEKLAEMLTFKQPEIQPNTILHATSATFCITGKLKHYKNRDELKSYIESIGGKVVGSMSSKVNYLINNDNTSTSSKNIAAKKAGIPIITEAEFLESFGQK